MSKLLISPDQDSYQLAPGLDAFSVNYGGGASRFSRAKTGAPSRIPAQWTLGPNAYGYFMAFYRQRTQQGSLSFTLDLLLGSSAIEELRARFVPGSVGLVAKSGQAFVVEGELEVEPPVPDLAADAALVAGYGA